tara:strand:- start:70 stop:672 length:603 start_codon:yes stop_codon:yes gene_type:complete
MFMTSENLSVRPESRFRLIGPSHVKFPFLKRGILGLGLQRLIIGFFLSLIVMACAPSETVESQPHATAKSKSKTPKSASVVTLRKNPSDGQFWTQARVNTGSVRFLVDTGAGMVALTEMDAKKAGVKTRDLVYDLPIRTAGGDNMAARIVLDRISVGAITIKDVDAMVVPTGLDVSLLGMTYLGELQSVQASPTAMTLRF